MFGGRVRGVRRPAGAACWTRPLDGREKVDGLTPPLPAFGAAEALGFPAEEPDELDDGRDPLDDEDGAEDRPALDELDDEELPPLALAPPPEDMPPRANAWPASRMMMQSANRTLKKSRLTDGLLSC